MDETSDMPAPASLSQMPAAKPVASPPRQSASVRDQSERSADPGQGRARGRGGGRSNAGGRGRGKSRGRGGQNSQESRDGRRKDRKEIGRAEWSRISVDKRARNEGSQREGKRRKVVGEEDVLPVYATKFSREEIEAQEKKPKRKVAVLLGYSGSGYKGMQLNHNEKTIEGDLFKAFVDAGAISKANADDPKKSSLVRCARTDKGVHAAGNVISLKLIVEEQDIVAKINKELSPQIRVWGIERTNGSFSAYQLCDSRIYEYLIPTHSFLPPHPESFLSKQMLELAVEANDMEGYLERQEEVADFWAETEEKYVKPVIEEIDPGIREEVLQAFHNHNTNLGYRRSVIANAEQEEWRKQDQEAVVNDGLEATMGDPPPQDQIDRAIQLPGGGGKSEQKELVNGATVGTDWDGATGVDLTKPEAALIPPPKHHSTPQEITLRALKAAHVSAKRAHRISTSRLSRIRSALSRYVGHHKFHNYTINKTSRDPSSIRIINSITISKDPIIIGGTEWLSLKVHGQSFMMHQIRKMVSMVALLVRCGGHEGRMQDTFLADKISIPKAPSLGLLLERPVFEGFNSRLKEFGRATIDFSRYEKEMEEFKQKEIYERIFREEERGDVFHSFFSALDHTRSSQLLYLSSMGIEATKRDVDAEVEKGAGAAENVDEVSSEDEGNGEEGG